jgi:hypothetical protein
MALSVECSVDLDDGIILGLMVELLTVKAR